MMVLMEMHQLRIGKYINRHLPDLIRRKVLTYIPKTASIENRPFDFWISINIKHRGKGSHFLNWSTVETMHTNRCETRNSEFDQQFMFLCFISSEKTLEKNINRFICSVEKLSVFSALRK
jgi:hypothetical protein